MWLQRLVLRTLYSEKSTDKNMSSLLFNIGHDIVRLLIDMITFLNEIRAESAVLKVLLWPLVYALTFAKVVTNYLAFGA